MTPRERMRALIRREPIDRLPYQFGGPRASTFAAVHSRIEPQSPP